MNKKLFALIFLFAFSISLASASHGNYYNDYYDNDYYDNDYTYKDKITETWYSPEKRYTKTRTTLFNYDNNKRYSTNQYRHGYSYRNSIDYRDSRLNSKRHNEYSIRYLADKRHKDEYYSTSYGRFNSVNEDYYYKKVPYLKEVKKIKCYNGVPDKLFYTPCP